ncbi:hypothetical protein BCR33DRAFT_717890 [Rhizoclosmatium globosum]|uniref:RanBD1 domain-containing protein n=1 Tax=Rhizoclosmatium globosum TaxID=329046 RepID=A0A1Y2C881_9FUNG|nr:hypothetical protein BCR33DRAFT_717890 [Rhizoclosmatium globosum]|eukprot:ORY43156.1 hypothetical protein BCR33DRAFT_717890 [Rhizoclosmatium globosum]
MLSSLPPPPQPPPASTTLQKEVADLRSSLLRTKLDLTRATSELKSLKDRAASCPLCSVKANSLDSAAGAAQNLTVNSLKDALLLPPPSDLKSAKLQLASLIAYISHVDALRANERSQMKDMVALLDDIERAANRKEERKAKKKRLSCNPSDTSRKSTSSSSSPKLDTPPLAESKGENLVSIASDSSPQCEQPQCQKLDTICSDSNTDISSALNDDSFLNSNPQPQNQVAVTRTEPVVCERGMKGEMESEKRDDEEIIELNQSTAIQLKNTPSDSGHETIPIPVMMPNHFPAAPTNPLSTPSVISGSQLYASWNSQQVPVMPMFPQYPQQHQHLHQHQQQHQQILHEAQSHQHQQYSQALSSPPSNANFSNPIEQPLTKAADISVALPHSAENSAATHNVAHAPTTSFLKETQEAAALAPIPQKESTLLKTTAALYSIDEKFPDGKLECAVGTLALKSVGGMSGTGRLVMYDDETDDKVLNIVLRKALKIVTCDGGNVRLCVKNEEDSICDSNLGKRSRQESGGHCVFIIRTKSSQLASDFVNKIRMVS